MQSRTALPPSSIITPLHHEFHQVAATRMNKVQGRHAEKEPIADGSPMVASPKWEVVRTFVHTCIYPIHTICIHVHIFRANVPCGDRMGQTRICPTLHQEHPKVSRQQTQHPSTGDASKISSSVLRCVALPTNLLGGLSCREAGENLVGQPRRSHHLHDERFTRG